MNEHKAGTKTSRNQAVRILVAATIIALLGSLEPAMVSPAQGQDQYISKSGSQPANGATARVLSETNVLDRRPSRPLAQDNNAATGQTWISGTINVGETIVASAWSIHDEDGMDNAVDYADFSYQWVRDICGVDHEIPDATRDSYTLTDADAYYQIKARVSFTDDLGNQETLTSRGWDVLNTGAASGDPPVSCVRITDQDGTHVDFGTFDRDTKSYSANVASTVEKVTVTTRTISPLLRLSVLPAPDADRQVQLAHGTNHVVVVASPASSDEPITAYTIAITRAGSQSDTAIPTVGIHGLKIPQVQTYPLDWIIIYNDSIAEITYSAVEGNTLPYVLTRTGDVSQALTVTVNVAETGGDVVSSSTEGQTTVTFAAGYASAQFSVPTNDDATWEEHTTVTVQIMNGDDYDVNPSSASSTMSVDDDEPVASTAVLSVSSNEVSEGDTITATVTVTTNSAHEPHNIFPDTMNLKTKLGTGSGAPETDEIVFTATNRGLFAVTPFGPVTENDVVTAYRFTYSGTIDIVDDDLWEEAESFEVLLELNDAADSAITIDASSTPQTISILEHEETTPTAPTASSMTVVVAANDDDTTSYTLTWNDAASCDRSYSAFIEAEADLYLYIRSFSAIDDTDYDAPQFVWRRIGSAVGSDQNQLSGTVVDRDSFGRGYPVMLMCADPTTTPYDPWLFREVVKAIIPYRLVDDEERPKPGTYTSGAPLTGLTTSHGTLTPAFNANSLVYVIPDVAADVERITLAPTIKNGYTSSWSYPADTDGDTPGHQVDLSPGLKNLVLIVKSDASDDDYRFDITVKRSKPEIPQGQAANTPATGAPTVGGNTDTGEIVTADTSTISDDDGLGDATFSYQWIRNDGTDDTDIDGATDRTYTLSSADEGHTIKVKVSFTDDQGDDEELTSAATESVTKPPLTASFSNQPAEHDGATNFKVRIEFSDRISNPLRSMKDRVVQVASGTAEAAKRVEKQSDRWDITIKSSGVEDVTVSLEAADRCKRGIACTKDRRPLSNGISVLVPGPPAISVSDATAEAGTGSSMVFTVSLGRVPFSIATVDCATSDGTATAGEDYTAASGTLTFTAGQQQQSVSVPLLNDATGGETFTLTLSNPSGGYIKDGTATGTFTAPVVVRSNAAATGAPTITGTAQVGETLTASTSHILDADGLHKVSYDYQWIRNDGTIDADIADANSRTYTLVSADQGKTIKVRVAFNDDDGNAEELTSVATASVAAKPNTPAAGAPTITGTAQVGETLTASTSGISDDDGMEDVSYDYQWQADGSDISGATGPTHKLTANEQGKAITVTVSFTDDLENDESLTSDATTNVLGPPLTATLTVTPSSHTGSGRFIFQFTFSEEPAKPFSYETVRDDLFTVTGGDVKNAGRLNSPSNIGWKVTVKPEGDGDVRIQLPVTTDCEASGAVCTDDARKLSNALDFTVPVPS